MGFSTIIDIFGSVIMGGVLMLILWRLNDTSTANIYNNGGELSLQQNLATIALVTENDFRKIGFCSDWTKIPNPSEAIILADSNRIKFLTDVEPDGNVDTMFYYLGPASELSMTENPNDRLLYRVINSETPKGVNLGVTQFYLVYFDALGDTILFPINIPGEVSFMEINIKVENLIKYENELTLSDTSYSSAFWRQIRLVARNLKNR